MVDDTTRTAIITGGGTGVGQAAALALSEAGWNIVVCGRRTELLENVVTRLSGEGLALQADVADPDSV
ncbi:MAG: NADP-dependent 3-hydroxy acid dehydrogenase YdfG, partial [Candidatus Poriferisodalaceae bacterium]